MINTLIIDDEQHCTDRLLSLIAHNASGELNVLETCNSMQGGLEAIRQHKPELIFLDVQLGPHTGFELLQQLKHRDFDLIFTTAYDTYAVQAFRYSAMDYLLKPIDESEFISTLEKIRLNQSAKESEKRLSILFHNLQSGPRRICIPDLNGFVYVAVNEIIRCQSNVNYTIIYLADGRKLTVARTLREFEDLLDGGDFFRVHNSHLININYIKRYHKGKGGMVVLTDDMEIEVSVRRKEEFLKRLNY